MHDPETGPLNPAPTDARREPGNGSEHPSEPTDGQAIGEAEVGDLVTWLRELSPDEFVARGLSVEGTFDEVDDPVLIGSNGQPVDTWRESFPYDQRLTRAEYEQTKRLLQIELLKAQSWIKESGQRLVVLFEGRDAAGKGGTIKRFTEHLNPRGTNVVALGVPTPREQGQWYFQRYLSLLPTAGEITLFDRSWYNRAVVERVMGYCSSEQYDEFMDQVPDVERLLVDSGTVLIKLWFSVSRREQVTRFTIRHIDPVRQWKLSPNDLESLDRWNDFTDAKEAMFARTNTEVAPWTVVRSNDKKRGRIEALRFVLDRLDYPDKDRQVVGVPDPLIVGPPQITGSDR
jgi:polyphosphate kinase 2